jgi:hypothetical protein
MRNDEHIDRAYHSHPITYNLSPLSMEEYVRPVMNASLSSSILTHSESVPHNTNTHENRTERIISILDEALGLCQEIEFDMLSHTDRPSMEFVRQ